MGGICLFWSYHASMPQFIPSTLMLMFNHISQILSVQNLRQTYALSSISSPQVFATLEFFFIYFFEPTKRNLSPS